MRRIDEIECEVDDFMANEVSQRFASISSIGIGTKWLTARVRRLEAALKEIRGEIMGNIMIVYISGLMTKCEICGKPGEEHHIRTRAAGGSEALKEDDEKVSGVSKEGDRLASLADKGRRG